MYVGHHIDLLLAALDFVVRLGYVIFSFNQYNALVSEMVCESNKVILKIVLNSVM
jgi:hypothetical protein